jgi:hypothetical protein
MEQQEKLMYLYLSHPKKLGPWEVPVYRKSSREKYWRSGEMNIIQGHRVDQISR